MSDEPKEKPVPPIVYLDAVMEAQPNKMFSEEHRQIVRFLRYSLAVACCECGRRSKHHWTMLITFEALTMAAIVPKKSGTVHLPFAPVCRDHMLAPAPYKPPPRPKKKKAELTGGGE